MPPERRFTPRGSVDFHRATIAGTIALAAAAAVPFLGGVRTADLEHRVIAAGCCAVFALAGAIATRSIANELADLITTRGGISTAGIVRLLSTVAGYLVVAVTLLGLLELPIERLVLSGAVTGVILGIAAQQSLANAFSGLVLLLSRPFTIGEDIVVNSGALGGPFSGRVRTIGLIYTILDTPDGPLNLPNAALMSAATGPRPPAQTGPSEASSTARAPGDAGAHHGTTLALGQSGEQSDKPARS